MAKNHDLEDVEERAEFEEGIKCDLISCFWHMHVPNTRNHLANG
jgi:hypothetical protein